MKKKILIAEDNELNMKLMKDLLTVKGYDVVLVYDGEAALNIIEKENFDLLLLDMQMPKKSGYDVLKEIKKNIPIIIVSAYARPEEIEKVKQYDHIDYITKPIQITVFLQKIEAVLNN